MIVTYRAPFAKAMIGKKINDDFTIEMGSEETKFTITAIEKISPSEKIS